ncbi:MAG: PqqD family peptide modification chaperone [Sphingomicrobium sp.]
MPSPQPDEISLDSQVVVASDQITSQLGDESVILSLNDGMYYGLDSIGTRIWRLLDRPHRVREVCEVIQGEYDVGPAECEQAVLALLRDLIARDLIETRP